MTATEVRAALRRRHGSETGVGEWVCIAEAFSGFANRGGGIDLLALGVWKSAKAPGLRGVYDVDNPVVAYEVKVSRADFRRELYGYTPGPEANWRSRPVPPWPGKQTNALSVADYFMFATPSGLLTPDEISMRTPPNDGALWLPLNCGLVEITENGRCMVKTDAERRRPEPRNLSRHEIAELIRHGIDPNSARVVRSECSRLRGQVDYWRQRALRTEPAPAGVTRPIVGEPMCDEADSPRSTGPS